VYEVHLILSESHDIHEVDHIDEFFNLGGFFKKVSEIFTNPLVKRNIDKGLKEYLKITVELAKLSLGDGDEEFENAYELDDVASNSRSSNTIDIKKSSLEDKKQAIEDKLTIFAGESESLKKYLEIAKLNTRIQANELIYKLADASQKKVLARFNREAKLDLRQKAKELTDLAHSEED
jgi:hypothetical protein